MTRIWIIDDEIDNNQAPHLYGLQGVECEFVASSPEDEDFGDRIKEEWDLILVDEQLWPNERDRRPPFTVDGVSLIAALRAWARMRSVLLPPLAILTNEERVFRHEPPAIGASRPISESFRGHEAVLSEALDIDALLSKRDDSIRAKIFDLACSFQSAREIFQNGGISMDEVGAFLQVDALSGSYDFHMSRIQESRPPINEEDPNGEFPMRGPSVIISWLHNRALQFPGLFVSSQHVALALGIPLSSLETLLASQTDFAACLQKSIYKGPLHSLTSKRFWSSAIDLLSLDLPEKRAERANFMGLDEHQLLAAGSNMVVTIDDALSETDELTAVEQSVRVNPKNWPSEAFQPWMTIQLARSKPWLSSWVLKSDRSRLDQ